VVRSMRVGVLELISYTSTSEWGSLHPANGLRRQFYSIMPQVVCVWCRQMGHDVFYATHYGQADPRRLLPNDLDIVFIATATQTSALAYALAKLYRKDRILTVAGGAHAKCFPDDCARFFDVTVKECDRELIADILAGRFERPQIVSSEAPPSEFPSVEERLPEIRIAAGLPLRRPGPKGAVPLLTSIGCPYQCEFCTEASRPYTPLSRARLLDDLRYLSDRLGDTIIAYHDPNFAIRFDETMQVIEQIPTGRRNRYIMECSLSVLKPTGLHRLLDTRCLYVAPGIESWQNFHGKAAVGSKAGRTKYEHIAKHLRLVRRYVPGIQANFIFGLDCDREDEPVELTKEFIWSLPDVWPNVNIPTPYGATPMFERLIAEDRMLPGMPLMFYCSPYLVFLLRNYSPLDYYERLIDMYRLIAAPALLMRRLFAGGSYLVRLSNVIRTLAMRPELVEMRRIRDLLASDRQFRLFHERRSDELPAFYHRRFEMRLGYYAQLLQRSERTPVLSASS